MEQMRFDVLVIGWGKAGKTLAGKLAGAGKKVALVEKSSTMYGGTCINIACVPTKTLIVSAERRGDADPAAYFADSVTHRDAFISKLRAANYGMLDGKVALIDGRAQFTGPHTVVVFAPEAAEGAEPELSIEAETIIINTGALPAHPPIPGIDLPHVYDSTTIQHADPFPGRLTIIGGSFIGLEFATMFNEFGSEVTVIDPAERLMPRVDEDVAASVRATMEGKGVRFVLGSRVEGIADEGGELVVSAGEERVAGDAVLVAVGRTPASADLGLDAAGIEVNERGFIVVDEHLRTNVEGVYAAGDINGGPQFTYVSFDDHRIILDDLLGDGARTRDDRVAVPWCAFLNPPLASVGMTETEAREGGREVRIAKADIAKIPVMPRPKILGNPAGMAKFVVDAASDKILGATLYCVDSQELINTVALAIRLGATAADLRDGIWTHPSSSEVFNGVL